jgi:hypothetical protein
MSRGSWHDVAVRTAPKQRAIDVPPAIFRELRAKASITAAMATHENVATGPQGHKIVPVQVARKLPPRSARRDLSHRAGPRPAKYSGFCESDNAVA